MCLTYANPSDPCCVQAPPVPNGGAIYRHVVPTFVDDYESLADAAWQFGTTGEPSVNWNANCAFYHVVTPSGRDTSVHNIMPPVRWSVYAPETDGQTFDVWTETTSINVEGVVGLWDSLVYLETGIEEGRDFLGAGTVGLRRKFLPRQSHARFKDNLLRIDPFGAPFPSVCRYKNGLTSADYIESTLEALAPNVPAIASDASTTSFPIDIAIHAIRHRINGQPIGRLYVGSEVNLQSSWQFRIKPTDEYSLDVWYRVGVSANPNLNPTPYKGCCYVPLATVATGDRWREHRMMAFRNVDYSPKFNPTKQTYELTVGGHSGWTLLNARNGPVAMEPNDNWNASILAGSVAIIPKDIDDSPWRVIALHFSQEIATAHFVTYDKLTGSGHDYLYRAVDDSDLYLNSSYSTKFGTIEHAPTGVFKQDGTTVFRLVGWSVYGGNVAIDHEDNGITRYGNGVEGRTDATWTIPRSVPRSLTFTRANREQQT